MLIVGAGAAGLATSALLAKHGVRSLLVKKRSEIFIYPKARNLSFRSREILRGLGLADEIYAIGRGVSDMLSKPTLNSTEQRQAFDVDRSSRRSKISAPSRAGNTVRRAHSNRSCSRIAVGTTARCATTRSSARSNRTKGASTRSYAIRNRAQRRRCAPTIWSPPTACTARSATRLA